MSRVLWIAADGRRFTIDTVKENLNTPEELQEYIQNLREEHGCDKPDFVHAASTSDVDVSSIVGETIDINNLPSKLKDDINDAISQLKPDPKTLN